MELHTASCKKTVAAHTPEVSNSTQQSAIICKLQLTLIATYPFGAFLLIVVFLFRPSKKGTCISVILFLQWILL